MPQQVSVPEVKLLPPGHKKSLWWLYLLIGILLVLLSLFFLKSCKSPTAIAKAPTANYGTLSYLPPLDVPDIFHSQRFIMQDGRVLFYLDHNHPSREYLNLLSDKGERFIPVNPSHTIAIFDPKDNSFTKLDFDINEPMIGKALLLSNGKLLVATDKLKTYDLANKEVAIIDDNNASQLNDHPGDKSTRLAQSSLIEVPGGVIISTYSQFPEDERKVERHSYQFFYDLKTNKVSFMDHQVGLPAGDTFKHLVLDGGKVLLAHGNNLYIFDTKTQTTQFMRKIPAYSPVLEGFPNSSLVLLKRPYYYQGSKVLLYDYKTNHLYSTPFVAPPLKAGHFENVTERGIPRDVEGEDTKYVEEGKDISHFYLSPMNDGNFLVTPRFQQNILNNSFGLMRVVDMQWLEPSEPVKEPIEIHKDLQAATLQDAVRLSDRRVMLLNRQGKLNGIIYTPAKNSTSEQLQAKALIENPTSSVSNFKDKGVWRISEGQNELLNDNEASVYPLKDGRLLMINPKYETKTLSGGTQVSDTNKSTGEWGVVYNPVTGKSKVLNYPKFKGQQLPHVDSGITALDGKIHFILRGTGKVWVFNPNNDSLAVRDLKYSGKGEAPQNHQWPTAYIVDKNFYFLQPTIIQPDRTQNFKSMEEYVSAYKTQNIVPSLIVYNPNNSTYYDLIKDKEAKVNPNGNLEKQYTKIHNLLPRFAPEVVTATKNNPKFNGAQVNLIKWGSSSMIVAYGREVKLFNYKRFKTKHIATFDTPVNGIWVTSQGDLVIYRGNNLTIDLLNPRTKKVASLTKVTNAGVSLLPGDIMLISDTGPTNTKSAFDIYARKYVPLSQPQILSGGDSLQTQTGEIINYNLAEGVMPNPLNASNGDASYLYVDINKPSKTISDQSVVERDTSERYVPDYQYIVKPGQVEVYLPAPGGWGYMPKWTLDYSILWAFIYLQIAELLAGIIVIAYLYKKAKS